MEANAGTTFIEDLPCKPMNQPPVQQLVQQPLQQQGIQQQEVQQQVKDHIQQATNGNINFMWF